MWLIRVRVRCLKSKSNILLNYRINNGWNKCIEYNYKSRNQWNDIFDKCNDIYSPTHRVTVASPPRANLCLGWVSEYLNGQVFEYLRYCASATLFNLRDCKRQTKRQPNEPLMRFLFFKVFHLPLWRFAAAFLFVFAHMLCTLE